MAGISSTLEAHNFFNEGMRQLDQHLLIGEREAKAALLVTMAAGVNIVLVGVPGTGKTRLATDSYRLIDGIDEDEDIAKIPPQSDLNALQLIGGELRTEKHTVADDNVAGYTETTAMRIDPLVLPASRVIYANEINRIAPHSLNALLEAFESRTLDTTAGSVRLTDMEYAISTMNPTESREGTFHMTKAMASRQAVGAELGADPETDELILDALEGNWKPTPDLISPVVDLDTLHAIRNRIVNGTNIPGNLWAEYGKPKIKKVRNGLARLNIEEGMGRLGQRIKLFAQAHAALHGQEDVDKRDFDMAARSTIIARLGVLGVPAVLARGHEVRMTATEATNHILEG